MPYHESHMRKKKPIRDDDGDGDGEGEDVGKGEGEGGNPLKRENPYS